MKRDLGVAASLAIVVVLTALAFSPALDAGLLSWDDSVYVTQNKLLRDTHGLREIWNPTAPDQEQFYPLVFTSYWLEYRLWKADSRGYHGTNLVLHLINVVLVAVLALRLGATTWVAVGAAAIFALHPVQVASVAWVAERKNVLSGMWYLAAFLLYLRHRRTNGWRAYAACLVVFAAALLSKTQTLTLPLSLLLTERLLSAGARLQRIAWQGIVARVAPMLVLGLVAALVTVSTEQQGLPRTWLPSAAVRPFIAAATPWFYAANFLLPVHLAPVYPRWNVSPTGAAWWIAVIAWPVAAGMVWRWGERIVPLIRWGCGHFLIALIPVAGLIPFGYQQFSFVADHFMYLAVIGGGVALATCADWFAGTAASRRVAVAGVGVVLLALCALRTYREAQHWHDTETFWRYAIARNPDCFPAHYSLGELYRSRRQPEQAAAFFKRSTEIRPDSPGAFSSYVLELRKTRGVESALEACNAKLKEAPDFLPAYLERAEIYARLRRRDEALADYERVLRDEPHDSDWWRAARSGHSRLTAGAGR